ncbi:MAG: nucleoside 2-deoxyribosyltransferase [Chitinophagales bacterium]|nr:nucleoside 2-deoxyribosyltransferase [Chitinophagales bacterium]
MKNKRLIAYLGISKSNRVHFDKEIESIRKCLSAYSVDLEVFVDKYDFTAEQEQEMMDLAFDEIERCNIVIVEVSKKAIGVGVEAGYAKAKGKPIIYLRRKDTAYSTTIGGASDYKIEYSDRHHLKSELERIIPLLISTPNDSKG